jgi:hypothetical protein
MLDVHAPHESVHTWRDFFIPTIPHEPPHKK